MAIIIVDDSPTNLIVLKQLARNDLFPVLTFSRPLDGLRHLEGNDAELILVDCEMPELNGIDFVIALRRLLHHRLTRVLMITQHDAADIRTRALEAGVSEVIHRGQGSQTIKQKIQSFVEVANVTDPRLKEVVGS